MAAGRTEAAPSKATSYTGRNNKKTQPINRVEKTQVSIGTLRHLADFPPLPSPLPFNKRPLKRAPLPQWLDPDSEKLWFLWPAVNWSPFPS